MKILDFIDGLNEWAGRIFSWLIVIAALIMIFEVISRRFFNMPTIWATELTTMIYGAYFILLMGFVHRHDAHIRLDMLSYKWSRKTILWIDLISFVVFFLLFVFFCMVGGYLYFWSSWTSQECAGTVFRPLLWPVKLTIPVGFTLLFLQGWVDFIRKVKELRGRV